MARLLTFLVCLALLPISLAGERSPASWRVAMTNFSSDDHSYRSLQVGRDFSETLGDLLYAVTDFQWVERQRLEDAFQEIRMGAYGLVDSSQAIRAGHWAGADLLLTGHFESDQQSRRLRLQAIDLQRADILGEVTVPMVGNRRSAILLRQPEVHEAVQAAAALLESATDALHARSEQKTIAPLFFRNADTARRLDYLEEKFMNVLSQKIDESTDLHLLNFPKADVAEGETEIVVSGLADVDHTAWQRVADLYVWGEYREFDAADRPLEEVLVEVRLSIWDGSGSPFHVVQRMHVKEQEHLLRDLVDKILAAANNLEKRDPSDSARRSVASYLLDREKDLKEWIEIQEREIPNFRGSEAATSLRRYRLALLETICFLDPNNRYAQWERLLLQGSHVHSGSPLLARVAVAEGFVRWFEQYGLDRENPATHEEAEAVFDQIGPLAKGTAYGSWQDLPWNVREAWQHEWSHRFVDGIIRWRSLAKPDQSNRPHPRGPWRKWMDLALKHIKVNELTSQLIDQLWPDYRQALLDEPIFIGPSEKELFGLIRQFYHRRGQPEKAEELLAGLEDLTRETRMKDLRQQMADRRARQAPPPPTSPPDDCRAGHSAPSGAAAPVFVGTDTRMVWFGRKQAG